MVNPHWKAICSHWSLLYLGSCQVLVHCVLLDRIQKKVQRYAFPVPTGKEWTTLTGKRYRAARVSWNRQNGNNIYVYRSTPTKSASMKRLCLPHSLPGVPVLHSLLRYVLFISAFDLTHYSLSWLSVKQLGSG